MREGYIDLVEFLVRRKFPLWKAIQNLPGMAAERAKLAAYEAELTALPIEKLQALYEAEKAKVQAELLAKCDREERERVFNQEKAAADIAHWSRMPGWSLDEATTLSFGKDPRVVTWDLVQPHSLVSPFAREYAGRRDLVLRAKQWGQLFDPVLPGFFLAWAKRTGVPFPGDLEAEVIARGHQVRDWKTGYDEAQTRIAELQGQIKTCYEERRADVAKCGEMLEGVQTQARDALALASNWKAEADKQLAVVNNLQAEVERLQRQVAAASDRTEVTVKPLSTKERETAQKLIIGMAVGAYRYQPKARRSDVVSEIAGDLSQLGIDLDEDTIRRWLKAAADLLPRENLEKPESETEYG